MTFVMCLNLVADNGHGTLDDPARMRDRVGELEGMQDEIRLMSWVQVVVTSVFSRTMPLGGFLSPISDVFFFLEWV